MRKVRDLAYKAVYVSVTPGFLFDRKAEGRTELFNKPETARNHVPIGATYVRMEYVEWGEWTEDEVPPKLGAEELDA